MCVVYVITQRTVTKIKTTKVPNFVETADEITLQIFEAALLIWHLKNDRPPKQKPQQKILNKQ